MNIKNKKIKMFTCWKLSSKKGFALIFAMMLSAVFLTIVIGVLNITTKELNFSTSVKDSNNAFFAADSGVECALYNDRTDQSTFTTSGPDKIDCFGSVDIMDKNAPISFSFNVTKLGINGKSCAKVSIVKTFDSSDPPVVTATKITSKGYNTGGDTIDCSSGAINRVERQIEVNY